MTLWRLVTREILHQKLNFTLGICSVVVAAGVLVAELTLLDAHDERTHQIMAEKEANTAEEMARMEDDYRKIMKKMGFNLLVLPAGQSLESYYATGYVTEYMPEEYVHTLANAGLMTIRHLLPSIERKIAWPEQKGRSIILVGTRGEVPVTHLTPKEPMLLAVNQGEIKIGYQLASTLSLKAGDSVRLLGESFRVGEIYEERGTKDDITVWIDLAKAQEMFGLKGKINAILALKCLCLGNELSQIRRDVARILPQTQVIEVDSKVVTRAEARERAGAAAATALAAERANRARMRSEVEKFAAWLIPMVIIGSTVWIALLALGNVRSRRNEIGILRALGLRSVQILNIFLAKAILLGIIGAFIGFFAGFAAGVFSGELSADMQSAAKLFNPLLFLLVLFTAPLLAALASWIPALIAAGQDPAEVLREE